jgi:hypothetical protein
MVIERCPKLAYLAAAGIEPDQYPGSLRLPEGLRERREMCACAGICARSTANWRRGTVQRRGRACLDQLLKQEQAVCLGGSVISGQCTQILWSAE